MFARFKPKSELFYSLFTSSSQCLQSGAKTLTEITRPDADLESVAARMVELEHECDRITHELFRTLNSSFVTPFDRSDIYVLGAVRTPRAVSRQHDTLVGAIAEAGGPIKNAFLSQVAIVRGSLDNPKIAIVNYNDIIAGKNSNVRLEPRDIVYVPFSPYRYLTKYLDLILLTFVRAVATRYAEHILLGLVKSYQKDSY